MKSVSKKVILYELNEVPFRVLDHYCLLNPDSSIATLASASGQYLTITEDRGPLSPWITWPTLHRGVTNERHRIFHFGQDLSEVNTEYPPVWEILARAGVRVGICGSLHSYPPPEDRSNYAFYLPDTFAAGPHAFPEELEVFQAFNLAMVDRSARVVRGGLSWTRAVDLVWHAPRLGLTAGTFSRIGRQLVAERLKPERIVRRRTTQAQLVFDVFMRQLRRTKPDFATFFTNHVASAMHRYWLATFPEDFDRIEHSPEWLKTYRGEIAYAMDEADRELAHLVAFVGRNKDYVCTAPGFLDTSLSCGGPD